MGYFLLGLLLVWVILIWAEAGFRPAPAGRKWLKEPGNPVRLATWVIAAMVVALTFSSDDTPLGRLLGSLRSEAISTAFAVIVINELGIYRAALQEKRSIIEQMGSPVNDAALEAVRLARRNGWLEDGALKRANLIGANLRGANLWDADLTGADLAWADLRSANLLGANLTGANLWGANLTRADLGDAYLRGANLGVAYLIRANLGAADLRGANLWGAKLTRADLRVANLWGAKLTRADLRVANLAWANLEGADLRDAMYDTHTMLPGGFDPVAAGALLVESGDPPAPAAKASTANDDSISS